MNKIGRMRNGSPICLITSMITDRIGRQEVLLPINHYYNKICYILGFFLIKHKNFREVFFYQWKKGHLRARVRWRALSYYTDPLVLKSGRLIGNQIWEFCYSYD